MKRYGMTFSTIRYWQQQAHTLRLYNGIYFRGFWCRDLAFIQSQTARELAHHAISAAFVHSPAEMRRVLETGSPNAPVVVAPVAPSEPKAIAVGDRFACDAFDALPVIVSQVWTEGSKTHVVLRRVNDGLDFGRFTPAEIREHCTPLARYTADDLPVGTPVMTPNGPATVGFVRLGAPEYRYVEAVSVRFSSLRDRPNYSGSMYAASDIIKTGGA